MARFTKEELTWAREMDLLTYLRNWEPGELVRLSDGTYCTRTHDSLKISNGKWHWFSQGVGGRSALDYLIKVKGASFREAVTYLLSQRQGGPEGGVLCLPPANKTTYAVERYLKSRGIHLEVIRHCLGHGFLYESKKYHSAVFVGRDREGRPRYGAIRGTSTTYKGEAPGSDKRFSFALGDNPQEEQVHLFESAIDAMSYATLELLEGRAWERELLLSLAGVFDPKGKKMVPLALGHYLKYHPAVRCVCLHLDNDLVGRGAAQGIALGLQERYEVRNEPPTRGKDVNEELQLRLGLMEESDR